MTEYAWSDLREHAVSSFGGQTPGGPLEQRIIDVFSKHPALVARSIDKIAGKYADGTVRSPWAVLAMDVEDGSSPSSNLRATDSTDREKAVMRAEQWINNAGMHYDRWSEAEDELFGDRGMLRQWKTDQPIRQRINEAWHTARPVGQAIETAQLERAAKWVDDIRNARAPAQQTPA